MKSLRSMKWGIVLILALSLILSACGSSGSSSKANPSDKKSDPAKSDSSSKPVTIVWSRGKDTTQASAAVVKAFEAKYPNIKVKIKELPNDSG
ncbi:MAG TPA: ABC transporter substrate-binding protein, partial [Candidatus Angelobacter sp.]|nr:ABC transporter substrate-binding protein [Candidatus Angelobacter sp.]